MSLATVFFSVVALLMLAFLASIARSCSELADLAHDTEERRRHG